jgi:hypothetical protein
VASICHANVCSFQIAWPDLITDDIVGAALIPWSVGVEAFRGSHVTKGRRRWRVGQMTDGGVEAFSARDIERSRTAGWRSV